MMNWQSIDTAPRDGTVILIYASGDGVLAGWWDENESRYPWRFLDRPIRHAAESIESNGFSQEYPPTHWMPLPEPPKD